MWSRSRQLISGYPELASVLVAAAIGLSVRSPFAWLTAHEGINILLAVLVFATAITIDPSALLRAGRSWRFLLGALAVGGSVLPALSWIASRVVAAGSLRNGMMTVGLAPCEIASVATTAMAGGEAALSAGVLIGSTVVAVAIAGPVLALESGHTTIHPGQIVVNLLLVVALPLAVGLVLRAIAPAVVRSERAATTTAVVTVAGLVALIAAQVHFSMEYFALTGALVLFIAASAAVGRFVGLGANPHVVTAVPLTTLMRDFAIAAGIATSAFGSRAAAPLGIYWIAVLVWGTTVAGSCADEQASARAGPRTNHYRDRRSDPNATGHLFLCHCWLA